MLIGLLCLSTYLNAAFSEVLSQYSSSTDLETIQEEIILDESIKEMIPEVPNQ